MSRSRPSAKAGSQRRRHLATELAVFGGDASKQVRVRKRSSRGVRGGGRGQHGISDVPARKVDRGRELVELLRFQTMALAEMSDPQGAPLLGPGRRELDDRVEPPGESRVQPRTAVA